MPPIEDAVHKIVQVQSQDEKQVLVSNVCPKELQHPHMLRKRGKPMRTNQYLSHKVDNNIAIEVLVYSAGDEPYII